MTPIRLEMIEDGGLAETEMTVEGAPESVILHRSGNEVRAWLNVCPHAGRRLDWAPNQFLIEDGKVICTAHGAMFKLADGECVSGPCRGASLTPVRIATDAEQVFLTIGVAG